MNPEYHMIRTSLTKGSDLYERWSVDVNWDSMSEAGWFMFCEALQGIATVPEAWIGCFPSSTLEPGTLEGLRNDTFITDGGKKPFFETGWFEVAPKEDLGSGVKEFLDKHKEKSVVYVR